MRWNEILEEPCAVTQVIEKQMIKETKSMKGDKGVGEFGSKFTSK